MPHTRKPILEIIGMKVQLSLVLMNQLSEVEMQAQSENPYVRLQALDAREEILDCLFQTRREIVVLTEMSQFIHDSIN
jgi:hypothetical protein